jgi:hypothetical protein
MMLGIMIQKIRRFRDDQQGVIAIETVILIPILIWGYIAMFTIFDTYRQYTAQQKAAYTIADLISRQATPMNADFIDGSHELFMNLTRSNGAPGMRVTVAKYDLIAEEYIVVWSRTRGGMLGLQSVDVANWSDRLPELRLDEQIIIVETQSAFTPVFNIGLGDKNITNFIFTRPRYATQVCYFTGTEDLCDILTPAPPEYGVDEQA